MTNDIKIPFDGNTKCQCGADFSKYGARCTCPRPKDDEIKPKYVDGVARCNSDECPGWGSCPYLDHLDQLGALGDISTSIPDMSVILCVPSMQKDLDRYKARCEELSVILCNSSQLPCGTDEFGWDDIPEIIAEMLGVEHWEDEANRHINSELYNTVKDQSDE